MKKSILLFIPAFLFSYDVEFTKTFSKDLIPDILSTNFSVSIEDDKEKKVLTRLEKFNDAIKKYDKVEKKLGRFNISPVYQHSSHTPVIKGYRGTISYHIKSIDGIFIADFVEKITDLKDNRDTSVSLSDLSWKVKESTYDVTMDILRLEAINWAENYTKILSKDINKDCMLKSINFSNNGFIQNNQIVALRSAEMIMPEKSEESIKLTANYKMECK